jgi:hypothetical protein
MLKWFRNLRPAKQRSPTDRALLFTLYKRNAAMALDVLKLTAAVDRNTKAITALVASHDDPTGQAAVDAAAKALDDNSAKAEAAVAPVVTA